jgi:membrane glycosyltransferase
MARHDGADDGEQDFGGSSNMFLNRLSGAASEPVYGWDLPPQAPLEMPIQDFSSRPEQCHPLQTSQQMIWRRWILIGGSFLVGLISAQEFARPLAFDGVDALDTALILLVFALFAWIAFGFLSSVAGFCTLVKNGPPRKPRGSRPLPQRRTAVLVPIYNEDMVAIAARLRTMAYSIEKIGAAHLFDFFVLSDSSAQAEDDERAAVQGLRVQTRAPLYYRRRPKNVARKPGNIADWVRRFGAAYEKMIVLDADSIVTGPAMARLAVEMEAQPEIGLIQTVPAVMGGRTLFARWQQFASAVYGPVASAGLRWWSGTEATFWGHNAIVRVKAFAESCGLPELSGSEPFGGHIMSHDMVEAALLRRRGWGVQMLPLAEGSYEEFPPTLLDYAVRDRRWCQGNLQHLRLLNTAGFHWVSRLQLLMGASAYLTSPLWMLLLLAGVFEPFRINFSTLLLQPSGWLMLLTGTMLIGPKLIASVWTVGQNDDVVESFGGEVKLVLSIAAEIPLAVIVAPVTMVSQCLSIIDILRGKPSGWKPQRRDVDGLLPGEAIRYYRWHMTLGAFFFGTILAGIDGAYWTLPVACSLLGSPLIGMLTSRVSTGMMAQRRGLFLIPAETSERQLVSEPDRHMDGASEAGALWNVQPARV